MTEICAQFAGAGATPKGVLKQMKVEGLTIYHVKSHLQIQKNLQLRLEEQGRCLQMMFEKQQMSGTDNPSAESTETNENNPAQVELKTTQLHYQATRHSPDDIDTVLEVIEGGSDKFKDARKAPEIEDSEGLWANVTGSCTVQPENPVILID